MLLKVRSFTLGVDECNLSSIVANAAERKTLFISVSYINCSARATDETMLLVFALFVTVVTAQRLDVLNSPGIGGQEINIATFPKSTHIDPPQTNNNTYIYVKITSLVLELRCSHRTFCGRACAPGTVQYPRPQIHKNKLPATTRSPTHKYTTLHRQTTPTTHFNYP